MRKRFSVCTLSCFLAIQKTYIIIFSQHRNAPSSTSSTCVLLLIKLFVGYCFGSSTTIFFGPVAVAWVADSITVAVPFEIIDTAALDRPGRRVFPRRGQFSSGKGVRKSGINRLGEL